MDRLKFKFVLAVIAVLTLTSCGEKSGNGPLTSNSQPSGFSIQVQETSFFAGGSLEGISVKTTMESGKLIAEVNIDNAADLKGMFIDLHYDAASWHPVVATPTGLLAPTDSTLHLAVLNDPGVVHFGEVMLNPYTKAGFCGSGAVARVEFALGSTPPAKTSAAVPLNEGSKAYLGWWSASSLGWCNVNEGDYDQNGEVNLADLAQIAIHFQFRWPPESGDHFGTRTGVLGLPIDGNRDGEINLADISVIAANFGNETSGGFNIYSSPNLDDYPASPAEPSSQNAILLGNIDMAEVISNNSPHTFNDLHFQLEEVDHETFYWVRPVDGLGQEGVPSTTLTYQDLDPAHGNPVIWTDDNGLSVTWSHDNTGDYNQDGLVSMADIDAIELHYGQGGQFNYLSVQSVIDGDGNGEINLSDIPRILGNYYLFSSGYNLYASPDSSDYVNSGESLVDPIYSVSMADAEGDPSVDRLVFNYDFGGDTPAYVWVRPFVPNGAEGSSSDLLGMID